MSTGQIIGAAVGAVVGAFIPGGYILAGAALGMAAGGLLFPEKIEGQRLEERDVQVSSLGAPIAVSFGTWRHTGNVIWPKDFQMDEHSHTESAKGGPEQETYTYTATFAVLLCKGPKEGIGRVWCNKKLVRDIGGTFWGIQLDPVIGGMRFMLGGEDQEPDPLMVARDGSAPAYRDSVIIIFEDLDCTDFGNRPPVVEAEVFGGETVSSGPPEPRVSYDGLSAPECVFDVPSCIDTETGFIWSCTNQLTPTTYQTSTEVYVTDDSTQSLHSHIVTALTHCHIRDIVYVPLTGEVWIIINTSGAHHMAVIYTSNPPAYLETVDLGSYASINSIAGYNPADDRVVIFSSNGVFYTVNPVSRTVEDNYDLTTTPVDFYIGSVLDAGDYLAVFPYNGAYYLELVSKSDYTTYGVIADPGDGRVSVYDPERNCIVATGTMGGSGGSMDFNVIDVATLALTNYPIGIGPEPDADYSTAIHAIVYCAYNDRYIFGADAVPNPKKTTLYIVNPDSFETESTYTYEDYAGGTHLMLRPLLTPVGDPNYLLSFDETSIKRLYLGSTIVGGPVTLASIVRALSTGEPGGLEDADIDVSELEEDLVDGYCVAQQMARAAAITPLMSAWYFDGLGSDHILKFPKRGRTPSVTIAKEARAAHAAGSDTPPDLKISRGAELELPYRVDVNYLTAARDYQVANQYHNRTTREANQQVTLDLPLVMTDSKAKSVAMVNLYGAWLRTTFAWSTDMSYAKYEPTDVFTITTDEATYLVRAMKRSDTGSGVIAWEGQIEDIAVYDQEGIVPADDFPPQVIRDPGDTILHLLDIPILRDVDDNPGFYTAMAGTTDGWRGAQLYKSVDGGSTYDPMLSVTNEAGIGTAQSVLDDFTVGNIFDEGNSVTIALDSDGPLISATSDQVLNGVNTAVIGAPGRWEVINYKNATLLAPDTYQLSGLLRGRRGTEWATGTHEVGDTFIWARTTTWQRPGASSSEIGLPRLYKAPPFRTRLSEADEQEFTNTAVGLKPYSVVDLSGYRDGADLVIEWSPRSRIGYGPLNAIVPVGEATESYRIQIMDGVTVKRTLTSSSPTVTYTAADQTTDWGGTAGPYVVQVAKMSATVGAGYIEEETLA